ncbi:hypothetical protein [Oceanisphaera sp. W20_SRM_FM3]|uniref:hypothetical protein n=1 Tax=Oceanisphaera sp. W20_SRM_FM3 TaxID=3240267 RepID=UPI003F9B4183
MRKSTQECSVLGLFLHKVTLYLILLNGGLLFGYGFSSHEWPLAKFGMVSLLLLTYQWLLVRLLHLQARRSGDGYLVYPVVGAGLLLALLLMRATLIAP